MYDIEPLDRYEQRVLQLAQEWADGIAFFDDERGFVAYNVEYAIARQDALLKAALKLVERHRK